MLWRIYSSLRFTVYSSLGLIPLPQMNSALGFLEDPQLDVSQNVTSWARFLWSNRPDIRDLILVDSVEHRKADDDWCHEFLRIHAFNKDNPAEHRYMDIDRDFEDKKDDQEILRDHPEGLISATAPANVQLPAFEQNMDVVEDSAPPEAGQQPTADVKAWMDTAKGALMLPASGLVNKNLGRCAARDEVHRGSSTHVTSRYKAVVLVRLTFPGEKLRLCDFAVLASTLSLRNPIYQLKNVCCYFYVGTLFHCAKDVFSGEMTRTSHFDQRGTWKQYGYVAVFYGPIPEAIDEYTQWVKSWTEDDLWVRFHKENLQEGRQEGRQEGLQEGLQKGRQEGHQDILQAIQAIEGQNPSVNIHQIIEMLQGSKPT
ncbi:hypothetical protein FISHEDRAFT_70409 [Fistulina hepatica ATCC 64428]|uniref:Essential protein Yae1 N-terminal domain-containing protein n=1 Tax=Fistulina hepatica ATCC 64428 TaxID=1128425 RepID=A0A0D7AJ77_9AGAR|nr:hypothetical protein FISHEDRAFT_70409 [Fistulina hepatica ATCC 64428]